MVWRVFYHVRDSKRPPRTTPANPSDDISVAPWLRGYESLVPKSPYISAIDWLVSLEISKIYIIRALVRGVQLRGFYDEPWKKQLADNTSFYAAK